MLLNLIRFSASLFILLGLAALSLAQTLSEPQSDNCCFAAGWQCESNEEWTEGYYAYQNNECPAASSGAASQQQASPSSPDTDAKPPVNNCCHTDWQCENEAAWKDGYYAYQNNACDAGPGANPTPESQRDWASLDNCCLIDRQCTNGDNWLAGYYAYQNGECIPAVGGGSVGDGSQSQLPEWRQGGNCCDEYWNCRNERDWLEGHESFKINDCGEFKRGEQPGPDYKPPWERGGNCCDEYWNCEENNARDRIEGHEAFLNNDCGEFKRGEQPGPDWVPPWERGGNCCDRGWNCEEGNARDRLDGHYAYENNEC